MAGFASTGGGSSGSGSASVGGSQVISPLALPELMALFNQIQGEVPSRTEMPSLQTMIQGGMNSPLLQSVLNPAMQRLQPLQQQQRQNLTETTRAAGGLRGSTYGQDMNTLQNNQALQSNDLMGQVIQQVLGTLMQGQLQEQRNQFLPGETLINLLNASRPQVGKGGASASSGWENIPASQGLATPMQSDSMGPAGGVQAGGGSDIASLLRQLSGGGGGTTKPTPNNPGVATPPPHTPYLDPLTSGGGGGSTTFLGNGQPYGTPYDPSFNNYAGGEWRPQTMEPPEVGGWW